MSVEFLLSPDILYNDRSTYGVLDYLGDLGGVFSTFYSLFVYLITTFSGMRMSALMTNRLYHVSQDSVSTIEAIQKAGGKNTNKLSNRPNGDIEVDIPYWLDWELLRYKACCCLKRC